MFSTFDVSTVSCTSTAHFDHGVEYPAQIIGVWNAEKEYQGQTKRGIALLVIIKDNNDHDVYRTMFMSLDGYVLGSRATYAKVMQGLLRCSDSDESLKSKIAAAGLSDLRSLVGRPCLARMAIKENGGRSWAYIDALVGETARSKGLDNVIDPPPVDIQQVCGRYIKVPSIHDCEHVQGLIVIDPSTDGLDSVLKEDDAIF